MTSGETRVAIGGKWKRYGREDIDGPTPAFILGTTEPTASNTGPQLSSLQTFGSQGTPYTYTISTPGIYERFTVYGRINITAQTGVTIRNVEVIMQASSTQINGILFSHADAFGNTIDYVRVRVGDNSTATEQQSTSIRGRGFTATRCDLSETVDGLQIYTSAASGTRRSVGLYGNYMHDWIISDSPAQGDLLTHNDGIQSLGYLDLEVIGNAIFGGRTSCIIVNTAVAGGYGTMKINDNWLYGYPTAGATINFATSDAVGTLEVFRNRVDRNGHDSGQITVQTPNRVPASYGAISGTTNGTASDWVYGSNKNVYMDDGSEVRIQVG
jgi:hypothetical protein